MGILVCVLVCLHGQFFFQVPVKDWQPFMVEMVKKEQNYERMTSYFPKIHFFVIFETTPVTFFDKSAGVVFD